MMLKKYYSISILWVHPNLVGNMAAFVARFGYPIATPNLLHFGLKFRFWRLSSEDVRAQCCQRIEKSLRNQKTKYAIELKLLYFELSPPWHLYVLLLANLLAYYLTYLLAFYLAYLLAFYLTYLLAYLLAFYLAYLLQYDLAYLLALYLAYLLAHLLTFYLAFYLANLLAFYLANILALYLAYLLAFYLAYLLAFYLSVEVQRCTLSWAARRLRSSGAHWAGQLAGWRPAVRTELGSWRRAWRRVRWRWSKAEVEVEEAEARRTARRTASRGGGGGGGHALW